MSFRRLASACLGLLALAGPAAARDLFVGEVSIGGGPPAVVGTNKLRNVPDFFSEATLQGIDPGYDATQAVSATLDLRGLPATMTFDALAAELRVQVPGAGIDVTLEGADRLEALANFQDWLIGELDTALASDQATTSLVQALVAHSPVDPVAGNPNSLQSRMFDADYQMGTGGAVEAYGEGGVIPSLASLNVGGGFYQPGDYDQYGIDVPLHFRFGFGETFGLALDLPVAFTSTQGAWTGMGSAGLGLHVRPVSWWTLTPAVRIGGVGSVDVGGVAAMYSGSLTSNIRIPFGPFAFGIGNMAGLNRTIDGIEVSGYGLSYELQNWNLRNGGYVEAALGSEGLGTGVAVRVHGSDSRFLGDDLWLDAYQEVGVAAAAGLPFGGVQVGVNYLFGDDWSGVSARLGLRF